MEGSQIKAMTDALTENTKVRWLNFGNNPLNTDAMYHIASLLRDSLFIKKLNLNNCM